MDPDVWDRNDAPLAQGGRMIAAAVASAVVTATLVIVIGQAVLARETPDPRHPQTSLIRTGG